MDDHSPTRPSPNAIEVRRNFFMTLAFVYFGTTECNFLIVLVFSSLAAYFLALGIDGLTRSRFAGHAAENGGDRD